jgi:tetratricopeptide (TPR) repeat protein
MSFWLMSLRTLAFVLSILATVTGLKAQSALIDRTIENVQGWKLGLNETFRGCLISASYNDGSTYYIGFKANEPALSAYLAITNSKWTFIENGKFYELSVRAEGSKNWRGKFMGVALQDEPGLLLVDLSVGFLKSFAASRGMTITVGRSTLSKPNLAGSSAAVDALINCQKRFEEIAGANKEKLVGNSASAGSGFYISSDRILTNAHVVTGCSAIKLSRPGTEDRFGRIIARDEKNDLALIGITSGPINFPPLRMLPRLGENVSVYGFPLAGVLASSGNFTVGHISALSGLSDDTRYIQISAPVQPGNSGGPVLDRYGNVVGVVVARYAGKEEQTQNLNFAIKISIVTAFLEANGQKPTKRENDKPLEPQEIAESASQFTMQVVCQPNLSTEIEATLFNRANELEACKTRKGSEAIGACSNIISFHQLKDDAMIEVLERRADLNRDNGDLEAAANDHSTILRMRPDRAESYNRRAIVRTRQARDDDAILDFNSAIRLAPSAIYYSNRARRFHAKGDFDRAISDFTEAIRLDPADADFIRDRGIVYRAKGQENRAFEDFSNAIQLRPTDANVWGHRGTVRSAQKDFNGAIDDFNESIRLNPKNAVAFNNRGICFFQKGDLVRAVADFGHSIELNPRYVLAFRNRARALEKLGKYQSAIADLRVSLALDPGDRSPVDQVARIEKLIETAKGDEKAGDN